jgi:hypothetical protein
LAFGSRLPLRGCGRLFGPLDRSLLLDTLIKLSQAHERARGNSLSRWSATSSTRSRSAPGPARRSIACSAQATFSKKSPRDFRAGRQASARDQTNDPAEDARVAPVAANGLADSVWKSGFKDALSFHLQSGAAGCFFRTRLGMVRSGEHRQSLRLFANSSKILFGLGAVLFVLLYIFGACATVVHLRGRERGRQIFDHSTLLASYNLLMYLFSAVSNRPILQPSEFPELKELRENWRTIRDEALVFSMTATSVRRRGTTTGVSNSPCRPTYQEKESIRVLRIKIYGDSGHNGDSCCFGLLPLKHVAEPPMGTARRTRFSTLPILPASQGRTHHRRD